MTVFKRRLFFLVLVIWLPTVILWRTQIDPEDLTRNERQERKEEKQKVIHEVMNVQFRKMQETLQKFNFSNKRNFLQL